jgi:hypothetical protein
MNHGYMLKETAQPPQLRAFAVAVKDDTRVWLFVYSSLVKA